MYTAVIPCMPQVPSAPSFRLKDPVSCITHLSGCIAAVVFTPMLLIHAAAGEASMGDLISLSVFMLSMVLLYASSAAYHAFPLQGAAGLRLKRLDHMSIFILIAGSYTPYCTIALKDSGTVLLAVIWSIAAAGLLFKFCWVNCPRWVSSVMYILMGWVVVFALPALMRSVPGVSFAFLLSGGIFYTIGGIIYALRLIRFRNGASAWGSHEVFHLFVMAGSLCHCISIYHLV